jgi:hypothetical protein
VIQNWLCGTCHSLNDVKSGRCYKCNQPRGKAEQPMAGVPSLARPKDPSLLTALIIGFAVATISVALWYWFDTSTEGRRAFTFSWLIGCAIGLAVLLGGRGRSSFPIVVVSFLLTVGALAVGEYLLISHYLAIGADHVADTIVIAGPQEVIDALIEDLGAAPLRPLMWAFAILGAVAIPWRGMVGD